MTERNHGLDAAVVAVLFLVMTWLTVGLRVYVRRFITKAFGIDDALAVLSLFLFTFYCAFVLYGVRHGTGQRNADLDPGDIRIGMKAWYLAELGYVACTTVLKISVGFFLLRVCVIGFQKITIWVVVSVVSLYNVYYFLIIIFQCRPTSYFWNQYDDFHHGECLGNSVISGSTYTHSALSVAVDWTLALLPVSLVWNLDMNPRTKISVVVILAMGALGSAATVIRIPLIYTLTASKDFLYANVRLSIWSTIEPGIGLTACSMATLRPLFKSFLARSRLVGSSSNLAWPQPHQSSHHAYFRSTSKSRCDDDEQQGLDSLPYESRHCVGNSTTIEAFNVPRSIEKYEEERKENRTKC